nr:pyruvate, phosphate dikinase [Alkalicoccus halolimnae]
MRKGGIIMIVWLHEERKGHLETVGGKGLHLVDMIKAGLPVPPGFVVTTKTYQQFLEISGIKEIIRLEVEALHSGHSSIEKASGTIQRAFLSAAVPEEISREIKKAYRELGMPPVAARSSATAEDLPEMSFAGQHDTYLNLEREEDVLTSVQKCWASLWNERALSYRMERGVIQKPERLSLAVVVQKMAQAEKAGVLFTANILNNRRDQILINSSWGSGESVVAGAVNPDQFIIDKKTGHVEMRIAQKKWQISHTDGENVKEAVTEARQKEASLTKDELRALYELAGRVDDIYREPMDTEWIVGEEGLFIVQARPVTKLFPPASPWDDPEKYGLRIYLSFHRVAQGITMPFTPMGLEVQKLEMWGALKAVGIDGGTNLRHYKTAAGRIYWDITAVLKNPGRWRRLADGLAEKDPHAGQILEELLYAKQEEVEKSRAKLFLPPVFFLKTKQLFGLFRASGRRPVRSEAHCLAIAREHLLLRELKRAQAGTTAQKWQWIEETMERAMEVIIQQTMFFLPGLQAEKRLRKKCASWFGSEEEIAPLLYNLPNSVTSKMGMELLGAARTYSREGTSPREEDTLIQRFLERYGHRSNVELDVGTPTWKEDPQYIVQMIENYMKIGDDQLQEKMQGAERAQKAAEQLIEKIAAQEGRREAKKAAADIRLLRRLLGLRERPKYDFVRSLAMIREVLSEIGEELVHEGRLTSKENVFYLTKEDLFSHRHYLDLAAAERKILMEKQKEWKTIPRFMTNTGECFFEPERPGENEGLRGVPVSGGTYTGVIKVIDDPREADLQPGEILVTHSTDPSWTPLFLTAGALILETGGPGSHGGIVAREYGLPAVAGIENVSGKFRTGERVYVDGYTGKIKRVE